MNRKIILSTLSIFSAVAIAGAATYAFFSSTATSTGNVFASGTFNLKLGNSAPAALDTVNATWTQSDMAPGGTPLDATLYLRNSGTVHGDHVHFKATNTVTDNPLTEDLGNMASHLKITQLKYDGNDILSTVPDNNANGQKDLDDLVSGGDGLKLGPLTDLNTDHTLLMSVQLDSAADNTYQGDSTSTVFTVTLDQNASQTP